MWSAIVELELEELILIWSRTCYIVLYNFVRYRWLSYTYNRSRLHTSYIPNSITTYELPITTNIYFRLIFRCCCCRYFNCVIYSKISNPLTYISVDACISIQYDNRQSFAGIFPVCMHFMAIIGWMKVKFYCSKRDKRQKNTLQFYITLKYRLDLFLTQFAPIQKCKFSWIIFLFW